MVGEVSGVDCVAEAVLGIPQAVRGGENAPGQQDQRDGDGGPRRRAGARDRDERNQRGGCKEEPLRLGQRRGAEHHGGERQQRGVCVEQRACKRDDAERDEQRERYVGEISRELAKHRVRRDDGEDRRSDQCRGRSLAQQRPQRRREAEREQRELDVDQRAVERVHRAEAGRLERRQEQRVLERPVRLRREQAVVDAAEVVQRPRLHRPDRPAVPLDERPHRERAHRVRQQEQSCDERSHADDERRKLEPTPTS